MDMAETGTEEAVAGRVDTRLLSKLVPVAWMVKDWFFDNRYSWYVLGVAAGAGILSTALACHVMLVPGVCCHLQSSSVQGCHWWLERPVTRSQGL